MTREAQASPEDVGRVVSEVVAVPAREKVSAFVHDVLGRQADGRTLFGGEKYTAQRAEAHMLQESDAETRLGNVLKVLERGPEGASEWALVSAFAVDGFGLALASARADERPTLAARLVAQADWLTLCTGYRPLAFVDRLLEADAAALIHEALASAVLRDEDTSRETDPAVHARNAARVTALQASRKPSAQQALARIAEAARGPVVAALVGVAGPTVAALPEGELRLSGRVGRVPRGPLLNLLRWLSGWALVSWTLRSLLALLGVRRSLDLCLGRDSLTAHRRLRMLGRTLGDDQEVFRIAELHRVVRSVRYPYLHLVLGVFCFGLGVLVGGLFVSDGARAGEWGLLGMGAVLLLSGAGLDMLLEVLISGVRGRVVLGLCFSSGRRISVASVPLADADAFLLALEQRLAHPVGD